jgi:hypothetical protein
MLMYTRIKAKCLDCTLHFTLCTWFPQRHHAGSLHCPECGQRRGHFLVWSEQVAGQIYEEVPGAAVELESSAKISQPPWWKFWQR